VMGHRRKISDGKAIIKVDSKGKKAKTKRQQEKQTKARNDGEGTRGNPALRRGVKGGGRVKTQAGGGGNSKLRKRAYGGGKKGGKRGEKKRRQ